MTNLEAIDKIISEGEKSIQETRDSLVKFRVLERILQRMILSPISGQKFEIELGKTQTMIRNLENGMVLNQKRLSAAKDIRVDIEKEEAVKS